jgi:beta-glucanase (GH16 family)
MKKAIIVFLFAIGFLFADSSQWKLIWSEEFDYTGLPEKTKWGYDAGCTGWGNSELESYTKENLNNAKVENGTLTITARKEKADQCNYTSARLVTKNKGDWVYGRFEIAAKIPKGRGIWPAIWMLPTDNSYGVWPKSGEIDIMENVGFNPNQINFTIHCEGSDKGTSATISDPYTKFVVYALEWNKDRMDFFADDKKIFTYTNDGSGIKMWPFDKRFHLLLNIAVGGSWGGQKGVDSTIFPQTMIIDYVRVYQSGSSGVVSRPTGYPGLPELKVDKNRLIVQKNGFKNMGLRLFTLNGKLLADYSHPIKACAKEFITIMPPGTFIAVMSDGAKLCTVPLAFVY